MKPLFTFLLILFAALPLHAHPGKTDRYGGHQCYKECAEWDLYYAEYHLHDKEGKAVRVAKKKPARSVPTTTVVEMEAVVSRSLSSAPAVSAAPPAVRAALVPDEPGLPLPWILVALFLLLLLVVRRRRKQTEGNLPSR